MIVIDHYFTPPFLAILYHTSANKSRREPCISSATCCDKISVKYSAYAECEIIHCVNCEILRPSVAMWNEICPHSRQRIFHICGANISQRSYFTCPKGQISLKKALAFASAFFWWGMVDSDHRSQWQQIYSLPPLAAREIPLILLGSAQAKPWSWWSESNQQPADYKSAALPLSHTSGTRVLYHKYKVLSSVFLKFFKLFFAFWKNFFCGIIPIRF